MGNNLDSLDFRDRDLEWLDEESLSELEPSSWACVRPDFLLAAVGYFFFEPLFLFFGLASSLSSSFFRSRGRSVGDTGRFCLEGCRGGGSSLDMTALG